VVVAVVIAVVTVLAAHDARKIRPEAIHSICTTTRLRKEKKEIFLSDLKKKKKIENPRVKKVY